MAWVFRRPTNSLTRRKRRALPYIFQQAAVPDYIACLVTGVCVRSADSRWFQLGASLPVEPIPDAPVPEQFPLFPTTPARRAGDARGERAHAPVLPPDELADFPPITAALTAGFSRESPSRFAGTRAYAGLPREPDAAPSVPDLVTIAAPPARRTDSRWQWSLAVGPERQPDPPPEAMAIVEPPARRADLRWQWSLVAAPEREPDPPPPAPDITSMLLVPPPFRRTDPRFRPASPSAPDREPDPPPAVPDNVAIYVAPTHRLTEGRPSHIPQPTARVAYDSLPPLAAILTPAIFPHPEPSRVVRGTPTVPDPQTGFLYTEAYVTPIAPGPRTRPRHPLLPAAAYQHWATAGLPLPDAQCSCGGTALLVSANFATAKLIGQRRGVVLADQPYTARYVPAAIGAALVVHDCACD